MKTLRIRLTLILAVLVTLIGSSACLAQIQLQIQPQTQPSSSLPNASYLLGFQPFFEGEYRDAERIFRRNSRSAYRIGQNRYLDSICYWTMQAECYYHMGNYAEAITLYEQSLNLYLSHPNWQNRIENRAITIQPDTSAVARARVNWGTSSRLKGVARVPDFQVRFGNRDVVTVLQQGGILQDAENRLVNVTEIMRCVALCLHRRRVIKGPTTKIDPLTARLVAGLRNGVAGDGSILGCYNGVCLGIAYTSQEEWAKASNIMKQSLVLASGLDHPLTPVGLLEAAYAGLGSENDAVAAKTALEASYSAAVFGQHDLVAEALTLGTMLHLKSSRSAYPPLRNSIAWARQKDATLLEATSIVRLAECLSEAGELNLSQQILQQSSRVFNRNDLPRAVIGARAKYVTALNQFLAADFSGGSKSLNAAMTHFNKGSLWIYRLQLTNQLAASGGATTRQVDQLYAALLHDPTELDWKLDPFEAITFLATPHVASMESWFETAVARRDMRQAFRIAELTRRHRFFANLPMGGRLMAFRWLLHAPDSALSPSALKQRTSFLARNPDYKASIQQAAELTKKLKEIPLDVEPKSEDDIQRTKLMKELAQLSTTQETILASMSLRREPAEMVFPPSYTETQIRYTMRPDQMALVTMATSNGYHIFMLNQKSLQYVNFIKTRNMHREISRWLKDLGGNQASVDIKQVTSQDWHKQSEVIADELFSKILTDQWAGVKEIIIVPDGALWYLPFEALLVGPDGDRKLLSEKVNIRYCPTASLAFGGQRPVQDLSNLLVLTGNLSPKTDAELATAEYEKLLDPLPEAQEWKSVRQPSSLWGAQIDQLLAWTFIRSAKNGPLQTAPLSTEQQKLNDGSLHAWMKLPWGAPQHMILPGYQSPGIGIRGNNIGSDLFLTTMGLMAAGSRTILISRWNTAGKTSFELSGNYAAKLKSDGNFAALAQARRLVRESDLDLENEPRLRPSKVEEAIKGEHPFFWASSMYLGIPDNSEPKIRDKRPSNTAIGPPPRAPQQPVPGVPPAPGQPVAGQPVPDQPKGPQGALPAGPQSIDDVFKGKGNE